MAAIPPLDLVDAAVHEHFGHSPARASVAFVGVEPIEVLRFLPTSDERVYFSLGMSRRPMSGGAPDPHGPRAELMLHLRDGADRFADVWRALAVLAAAPSVEGVVYSPGMSTDLGQPLAARTRCTGVVLTESPLGDLPTPLGPVTVLLAVPATAAELAWCRVRGSAALRARWREQGCDLLDLSRPAARLE